MIKIAKYKDGPYWAVWRDNRLLAVVCYKKGAAAIKALLSDGRNGQSIENLAHHNLKTDLGAIERLARQLNQRISKTVNKLENPPE